MRGTVIKVTRKGQVTIPSEIRERLGIREGDKVVISIAEGNTVALKPVKSLTDILYGSLHELAGQLPTDPEDLDRAIADAWTIDAEREGRG